METVGNGSSSNCKISAVNYHLDEWPFDRVDAITGLVMIDRWQLTGWWQLMSERYLLDDRLVMMITWRSPLVKITTDRLMTSWPHVLLYFRCSFKLQYFLYLFFLCFFYFSSFFLYFNSSLFSLQFNQMMFMIVWQK